MSKQQHCTLLFLIICGAMLMQLQLVCGGAQARVTWCVVNAISIPEARMKEYIETACKKLDCSAIKPGGPCYEPKLARSHASYVLNLSYRKDKVCPKDIGLLAATDPSYEKCKYP